MYNSLQLSLHTKFRQPKSVAFLRKMMSAIPPFCPIAKTWHDHQVNPLDALLVERLIGGTVGGGGLERKKFGLDLLDFKRIKKHL